MNLTKRTELRRILLIALIVAPCWRHVLAQTDLGAAKARLQGTAKERDGKHDFDFNIGTWKTHVSRLVHPLTGSTTWVEYEGLAVVRKVWDGRASLFELEVDGPAGHIEGVGLRLYNPQSRQWSLNWANSGDGTMNQPMIGEFKNGRGDFTIRKRLVAEPSRLEMAFRRSLRIRRVLNRHS